jgi:ribosome-binding protein aMBF1 (putative translation factor)
MPQNCDDDGYVTNEQRRTMEMDQKKVGMFIAETRKQKGLTQKELAEGNLDDNDRGNAACSADSTGSD